jgi:hypothetical protein
MIRMIRRYVILYWLLPPGNGGSRHRSHADRSRIGRRSLD